jgi:hypothetical protein
MKKLLYTLIIILGIGNMLQAQYLLHNKLIVDVTAQYSLPFGPSTTNFEGVELPGLLGNMSAGTGVSWSAKYRPKKGIGAALSVTSTQFDQWTSPNSSDLFDDASFFQVSFRPGIMFSTPYTKTGRYNRLALFAVVGPAIGMTDVTFGEAFSWYGSNETNEVSSSGTHIGAFADCSINYGISRSINLHADVGYSHYFRGSELYESSYGILYFGAGVGFRFMVDKNFLYE